MKENPSVLDVFLFGSAARGKREPRDVDVLVLFKGKADSRLAHSFERELRAAGVSANVEERAWKELFEPSFRAREAVLSEAVSVVSGKRLCEAFGFTSFALFKYAPSGMGASERVKFQYALFGRRVGKRHAPGMLEAVGGKKLTAAALVVPVQKADEFTAFLTGWRVPFKRAFALFPTSVIEFGDFIG